jgi:WD40-like Beta Propeller Repeat
LLDFFSGAARIWRFSSLEVRVILYDHGPAVFVCLANEWRGRVGRPREGFLICSRWAATAAVAALVTLSLLLLVGCGGAPAPNATPAVTQLAPSEITAGSQAFTMFVSGTNFQNTSTAQWNGSNRPATYNSNSTQLAVSITAADVQNAGTAQVTVTNPAPGGGTSLALSFTINPVHSGGPTITSLSPSSAAVNGLAFTLQVTGTNFLPGSDYVTWNDGLRPTCTPPAVGACSSTQLFAAIFATDLTQQVLASVAVHRAQVSVSSPSVSFQVGSATSSNVKFPQVVSVNASGGPADGASSSPAMSADGRYVAFYSEATNLIAGASGNIFVRDTCSGAANCTPRTIAVDLAQDGSPPNAPASSTDGVAISADGRRVAFASWATNLTSGAAPTEPRIRSVFIRDACLGNAAPANCVPQTEVVSIDPKGDQVDAQGVALSANGRFVVFASPTRSLASGEAVFVRDTCDAAPSNVACTPRTVLASIDGGNQIAAITGTQLAISADGRYVAFAGNPVGATASTMKPVSQIFVRDTCFGVSPAQACAPSASRASVSADGELANADSRSPSISGDGRYLVFQSSASNLGGPPTGKQEIYFRDTCVGPAAPPGCVAASARISGDAFSSSGIVGSYSPALSSSGRYITYMMRTETDDPWVDSQGLGYLVVWDTCFGATGACSPRVTQLTALDRSKTAVPLTADIRTRVPISDDGRVTAFFTNQAVPANPLSGLGDVFLTTTPFHPQH